jgi:exopolysaccharide production protein ExoQ
LVVLAVSTLILIRRPLKSILQSRLFIFMMIYMVVVLASTAMSIYAGYSFIRVTSYLIYLLSAPIATLLVVTYQDIVHQQRAIFYILVFSLIISAVMALVLPGFAISPATNRFVGIYSYPNMTSRFAVLALMFTWLFPTNWWKTWERWLWWALIPLWILLIILTKSRSTFVGLFLVIAYVLWRKYPHLRLAVIITTPFVIIISILASNYIFTFILGLFGIFPHSSLMSIREEFLTFTGRTPLWKVIFENFPISLTGIGYKTLFYSTNGLTIRSQFTGVFGGAHNAFIEPIIETGILGTLSLALFLITLVRSIASLPKSLKLEMGELRLLIIAYLIFIFSQSMLEGLFDNGNVFYWLMIYYGFLSLRIMRMEEQLSSDNQAVVAQITG